MLGSLQRIAERKAQSVRRGKIEWSEAVRWEVLGEVLERVRRELKSAVTHAVMR